MLWYEAQTLFEFHTVQSYPNFEWITLITVKSPIVTQAAVIAAEDHHPNSAKEKLVTQLRRFILFIFVVLGLATIQASGQVCSQPKYANTIACLPSKTANAGMFSAFYYVDPSTKSMVWVDQPDTPTSPAVPLGIGAQYASQVATSPSAATSAGYVFTFDKGILSAKPADLGPLLSDLPQTIGRNRFYVGTSYQWMSFSKTGGKDINSFNYEQGYDDPFLYGWHRLAASASLTMHSFDTYLSYGITDRLDISVVIPWSQVSLAFKTKCRANDNVLQDSTGASFCYGIGDTGLTYDGNELYDVLFFQQNTGTLTSSGIGDVTLRGKYELLKNARQGLALGVEYRLPTGDPLNLQGSGATGLRPFLAWGYSARVSPHANIGFQYNGSSINDVRDSISYRASATDFTYSGTLTPTKLPNTFTLSGGADVALTRRINLDADLLERVFSNDGSNVFQAGFPAAFGNAASPAPVEFSGVKDKSTVILGAKGKLIGHLLFGASVMIDATNNGLSYKPSPIATLSYDFGGSTEK
jgi:hypothetical protein